jgi:hypothetical protein
MVGLAAAARAAEAVTCEGSLDVTRYRGILKARTRGRARRRSRLRRPLLREKRHAQDQARRVQAELHPDPQRSRLHSTYGECMSPQDSTAGSSPTRYYGKYRGLVINNIDPLQIGRVMVQCADVLGEIPSSWALPCVPAAGIQAGMFIIAPIGSQVWVEFEQGNPDYPSGPAASGVSSPMSPSLQPHRRPFLRGRTSFSRPPASARSSLATRHRLRPPAASSSKPGPR